jgi:hypothetical protein
VRRLERIPLTEQGKIDRAALTALLDPPPQTQTSETRVPPVGAR